MKLRRFIGMRNCILVGFALLALLSFATRIAGHAQVASAALNGTIQDNTGALIPGAKIAVVQTETNYKSEGTSADDGSFRFPSIPVGPYKVQVTKEGFTKLEQSGIVLRVGQVATLQLTLTVGSASQNVVVTAEAPTVESTESTIQNVVEEKTVSELPLNGRNPAALMYVTPGVTDAAANPASTNGNSTILNGAIYSANGAATESSPTTNGVRPGGTYFSLDGAGNVDPYLVIGGPFPNPDATQEFSVVTGSYGARYVSAPGGAVNIVTKSGTNQIHGSAFEFVRNGYFNARNYFSTSADPLKRNQLGGAAGGPILKNRLFVFGSFQETIIRAPNLVNAYVGIVTPTENMQAGQFMITSGPNAGQIFTFPSFLKSTVITNLMKYVPPPNYTLGGQKAYFNTTIPAAIDDPQWVGKIDYNLGSHRFFARYFGDHGTQAYDAMQKSSLTSSGYNVLTSSAGGRDTWDSAAVGDTWTSKSVAWIVDARASLLKADAISVDDPTLSQVSITNLGATNVNPGSVPTLPTLISLSGLEVATSASGHGARDSWDFSADVIHSSTKHQLSFGADVRYIGVNFTSLFGQAPQFEFLGIIAPYIAGGNLDNNSYADMWYGHPGAFEQADGTFNVFSGKLFGLYAEDKYRVSEKLTLTGGLRWDPYFPYTAAADHIDCWNPGQQSTVYTNAPKGLIYPGDPGCSAGGTTSKYMILEPRLGAAYKLDRNGNTAIRAGWGMYSTQFQAISMVGFSAAPFVRNFLLYDYLSGMQQTVDSPWTSLGVSNPFANGFQTGSYKPPSNVSYAQAEQVGFSPAGIDKNFKPAYVEQWTLSLQHQFTNAESFELAYVGTQGIHIAQSYDSNLPVYSSSSGSATRPYASEGIGQLLSLVSNSTSNYNGLNATYHHRSRGGLDLVSAFNWSKCLDDGSQPPSTEGAFNATEEANNLTANGALLPHNRYGRCDFDQNVTFRNTAIWNSPNLKGSGTFLRMVAGSWTVSGLVVADAGQPFSVKESSGNSQTGLGLDLADRVAGVPAYLNGKLNRAAFSANAAGTYGNSGRNAYREPKYVHIDPAVMKTFPLGTEKLHFIFRAEAFNIFNHPTFTTSGWDYNGTPSSFGVFGSARDPRQLQFSGKLQF